ALDQRMRLLLMACGPINVTGALIFAPPFPLVRHLFGLPEAHPLYLWLISIWIFAFGVAYWQSGRSGHVSRTFLAVGATGKASFALLLIALAASGDLPAIAILPGLPDLAIAAVFMRWLVSARC